MFVQAVSRRLLLGVGLLSFVAVSAHAALPVQHWSLDNGARVYFVETHALPMVDVQVDLPAGSALDPADKIGLSGMVAGLLGAGAGGRSETAIADAFADVGAAYGASTDADRSSVKLRSLSSAAELERASQLVGELLGAPDFPQAVLEREKQRAITGLRDALTRPATVAERAFSTALYGNHPYGYESSEQSIAALSRDDLLAFHRQHYRAADAVVSIVGDLDRAGAEALARTLLGRMPKPSAGREILPGVTQPEARRQHIDHPSAQAHVLMGMPALTRDDPDYFPLLVGNYVLGGGGFVSRLLSEVREKRGFAYSTYSVLQPMRLPGPFQIGLQTRGSQADEAVKVVEDTLRTFLAEGPTEAETQAAKDNLVNGFGLRLDSNGKVLGYLAVIGFYQLPDDWLEEYPLRVAAVSREDVMDAFRRRIRPEHMVTVIVGGSGDGVAR